MASSKKYIDITCATCGSKANKRSDFVEKVQREGRTLVCSKKCAVPHRKESVYKALVLEDYSGKHRTSICKLCKKELPIEQFIKNIESKRMKFRSSWFCEPCRVRRIKEYRLKSKYQMESIDDFDQMLLNQKGLCAICNTEMSRPCIDHNHETGAVRKLLCVPCNAMIGNAYEDIKILRSAIKYLQQYE